MQILLRYKNAIKNLNKKYYLTPFLILIYVSCGIQLWDAGRRFIIYSDKDVMSIVLFIVSFFKVYTLIIIQIFCYPHANFFIQTTELYRKIFGSTWSVITSGLSKYKNIGKDIPDDYHIRSSGGVTYTVSSGFKTKRERIGKMRSTYVYFLVMKFFFKDIVLRMFTHLGIFIISPILFLYAAPRLEKKGQLNNLEV
ncbi:hypothetical protein [Pontibacillus litoralis]|uniref:Uncharacterized protein n=1 Tax=Pontibacillus litoralis JSM 072002 TaxID=1385512 RepID=A0A0A5G7V3_9BACI|nr:hypothetical protein [Pontibacillus litoralis]KGX89221.1 hypothetical protein N784_02315 [Pontibacillus litoralis JSM 072002]